MPTSERSIFINALDKASADERAAYLDEACGLDAALRQRVEGLLRSHTGAGSFLAAPALDGVDTAAWVAGGVCEGPGTRIGHYKLLERLGEGGMGVVYMAEQEAPVRRRVALKIIKPGMDSAQVVARFEAERQALAVMDHINIARVLDAGTTDAGRPFFVMELVHGTPITTYCDDHRLTLRERLELFVPVCHAIQHAHQKGVIHRDVKPGNVLVTLYDGKPVPKVIDFGVAKAIEQRLTERTMFTRYGTLVGTFEYMAPEQAEMSALGVDTRSDVYSLGVLLYELLTGTTPLERERLRAAAFQDVLRLIREEEPQRPSLRLSTSTQTLAAVSERRRTDAQRLPKLVRGELDWVVMKCLEKDRSRRYGTADALADDVASYLEDRPVSASPPSVRYKLRKFARRNKALIGTVAAVSAALLVGSGLAAAGFVRARIDRDKAVQASKAEAEQRRAAERNAAAANASAEEAKVAAARAVEVSEFLRRILSKANLYNDRRGTNPGGPDTTVRQLLDEAVAKLDEGHLKNQPGAEAAVRSTIGTAYQSLAMQRAAQLQLATALDLQKRTLGEGHPDLGRTLYSLGSLASDAQDHGIAAQHYRECLAIYQKAYGEDHEFSILTLSRLAHALDRLGDRSAEALHDRAVALARKAKGKRTRELATSLQGRGVMYSYKQDWAAAESHFKEAMEIYRELDGDGSFGVAKLVLNLGLNRMYQDDLPAAEAYLRDAVARYRKALGPEHPDVYRAVKNLQVVLDRKGERAEAAALQMDVLRSDVARLANDVRALPADHGARTTRADYLARLGKFDEALAERERVLEQDHKNVDAWFCIGVNRLYLGDVEGYRSHARRMVESFKDEPAPDPLERAAKIYCLAPPPGDDMMAVVVEMARKAAAAPHADNRIAWYELSAAMAEYRAGNDGPALEWQRKFESHSGRIDFGDRRYPEGTAIALAALIHHRAGRLDRAREQLARSEALLKECPQPGVQDLGYGPDNWAVWMILHREAEHTLAGAAAGTARVQTPHR